MTAHREGISAADWITLTVDGADIPARAGENVAATLLANGWLSLRRAPRSGGHRGAFCMMGVCQECVMLIDGVRRPACMAEGRDGMIVEAIA